MGVTPSDADGSDARRTEVVVRNQGGGHRLAMAIEGLTAALVIIRLRLSHDASYATSSAVGRDKSEAGQTA